MLALGRPVLRLLFLDVMQAVGVDGGLWGCRRWRCWGRRRHRGRRLLGLLIAASTGPVTLRPVSVMPLRMTGDELGPLRSPGLSRAVKRSSISVLAISIVPLHAVGPVVSWVSVLPSLTRLAAGISWLTVVTLVVARSTRLSGLSGLSGLSCFPIITTLVAAPLRVSLSVMSRYRYIGAAGEVGRRTVWQCVGP